MAGRAGHGHTDMPLAGVVGWRVSLVPSARLMGRGVE